MPSDSDATTVRIAPRVYSNTESSLSDMTGKGDISRPNSSRESGGDSSVSMMIGADVGQEQEDGDVTDRYLIKESDVKDKSSLKGTDST